MENNIKEISKQILDEINKSKSILLHCHPSPDPDSMGSALAMKFALEGLNKKVTVIKGDSEIPQAFMHFPGAKDILQKNFGEINIEDFDLFIILDSSTREMISGIKTPIFPLSIKSIVIDHHLTNTKYGDINFVDSDYPATSQMLFDLFKEWNIKIDYSIALNLFMGIYTDTGGFKYQLTDYRTLEIVSELAKIAPDYHKTIFIMENSENKESIYFKALALNSIKTYFNDNIAVSMVSNDDLKSKNIDINLISVHDVSNILKSVIGWNIGISMVEVKPNIVKISLRTRDSDKYNVSLLAKALGGGGHTAAAGAVLSMPLEQALSKVVETAKLLYNL